MKLTSQQKTALYLAAEGGKIYPYLLKRTIPSLIKKGLLKKAVPPPYASRIGWWEYKITQDGYDIYEKLRIKKYQKDAKNLDDRFHQNIKTAKNRIVV